jgi:hypothetical protein
VTAVPIASQTKQKKKSKGESPLLGGEMSVSKVINIHQTFKQLAIIRVGNMFVHHKINIYNT